MYHCAPSSMSAVQPHENGTRAARSPIVTSGYSIGAGKAAATWTGCCSRRERRGEMPIHTPAGTVHRAPTTSAPVVRRNVSPRAPASVSHSCPPSSVTRRTRCAAPQPAKSSAPPATAHPPPRARRRRIPSPSAVPPRAGCRLTRPESRAVWRPNQSRMRERRSRSSTSERGTSVAAVSSTLNFCAHTSAGRQTTWSTATIMTIIAATA